MSSGKMMHKRNFMHTQTLKIRGNIDVSVFISVRWWLCLSGGVLFSICRRYDEMSDKVSEMPEDTEALVNLQKYLRQVRLDICTFI